MKISVRKAQNGVYALSFDDITHTLTTVELKALLQAAVLALSSGDVSSPSPAEEARDLAQRLTGGNDAGLQKLILTIADDDLLMFLKATENDPQVHAKLFDNMSARKHKMISEDLEFRFTDGLDEGLLGEAVIRIIETTNQLQDDGVLELST